MPCETEGDRKCNSTAVQRHDCVRGKCCRSGATPGHKASKKRQKCNDVLYRKCLCPLETTQTDEMVLIPIIVPSRSTGIFAKDRYHNTGNSNTNQSRQVSHLVKHTDIISSLSTSVRVVVVVMELWTTHATQARFAHASRSAWAHVSRWWHPCWTTGASHVRSVSRRLNSFAIIDLGHSSHTSAPQSRVLVAVAPTVNGSLNETPLSTQTRIQLSESPSDSVALRLVDQAVPTVLILTAASSGVNAVLGLELWAQSINID